MAKVNIKTYCNENGKSKDKDCLEARMKQIIRENS